MTLLTVAEFKALVSTSATDAAIQLALDATEEEILSVVGPIGNATERIRGGMDQIMLGRRASFVLGVYEVSGSTRTTLDATDYELSPTGQVLRRLDGGTHPQSVWQGQVEVIYTPYLTEATRKSVQAELTALDLGVSVGSSVGALASQRIGEWSETYATSAVAQTPMDRRQAVLDRLNPPILVYWRGSGDSTLAGVVSS